MSNRTKSPKAKCPICRKDVHLRKEGNLTFPFCSERCQMHDLGNWLNEAYTLPISENATERKLVADFSSKIGDE